MYQFVFRTSQCSYQPVQSEISESSSYVTCHLTLNWRLTNREKKMIYTRTIAQGRSICLYLARIFHRSSKFFFSLSFFWRISA